MKKFLATITMICYLAFTGGVVVNLHFCMHELASTEFYGGTSKVCGKCGMHKQPNGCCEDELMVIKIDDDQQTASNSTAISVSEFSITYTQAASTISEISQPTAWQNHSPPLLKDPPLYLQNRVFRI